MIRAYPGLIDVRQLSPEQLVGLYMNIPALEAIEDLRVVMATAGALGGEDAEKYVELLQDVAWYANEGLCETGKEMLQVTKAKRERTKAKHG